MNPKNCHSGLPSGRDPFYYIRIDGESTDRTNPANAGTDSEADIDIGPKFSANNISSITTIVNNKKPSKSANPEINFFARGKPHFRETSKHCNWAGNECWTIRIHPKIESISANSGYLEGSQTLMINGYGLLGTTTTVMVDGVECKVDKTKTTDEVLYCVTGAKATPSSLFAQPGQPGITETITSNPQVV